MAMAMFPKKKTCINIHWNLNFIEFLDVMKYSFDLFNHLKMLKPFLAHGLYKISQWAGFGMYELPFANP